MDTVNGNAMATNAFPFRVIDLYTVKVEGLTFDVPFELEAMRDDYIHALVAYFDTEFTCCHKPVRFGTGPADKYTHWKQVCSFDGSTNLILIFSPFSL